MKKNIAVTNSGLLKCNEYSIINMKEKNPIIYHKANTQILKFDIIIYLGSQIRSFIERRAKVKGIGFVMPVA